ncbi:hypothetical protein AUP68_10829 [Ilyonectria robusta]
MNSFSHASAPAPLDLYRASRTSSSTSDQGSAGYFDSPAFVDDKQRTGSYSSDETNRLSVILNDLSSICLRGAQLVHSIHIPATSRSDHLSHTVSTSSDVSVLDSASSPPKSAHPWI